MLILGHPSNKRVEKRGLAVGKWAGRRWCKGVVYEEDLKLNPKSKLLIKLLVFGTPGAAVTFGQRFRYGGDVRGCYGWVMECSARTNDGEDNTIWFDPRYVCVIGFVLERLSVDVVAHEAVHAAFAWGRRTAYRFPWPDADKNGEEHIAWPTGVLTSTLCVRLVNSGILDVSDPE